MIDLLNDDGSTNKPNLSMKELKKYIEMKTQMVKQGDDDDLIVLRVY